MTRLATQAEVNQTVGRDTAARQGDTQGKAKGRGKGKGRLAKVPSLTEQQLTVGRLTLERAHAFGLLNPEVAAIQRVGDAIKNLSPDEQERVLHYIADRFEIPLLIGVRRECMVLASPPGATPSEVAHALAEGQRQMREESYREVLGSVPAVQQSVHNGEAQAPRRTSDFTARSCPPGHPGHEYAVEVQRELDAIGHRNVA